MLGAGGDDIQEMVSNYAAKVQARTSAAVAAGIVTLLETQIEADGDPAWILRRSNETLRSSVGADVDRAVPAIERVLEHHEGVDVLEEVPAADVYVDDGVASERPALAGRGSLL